MREGAVVLDRQEGRRVPGGPDIGRATFPRTAAVESMVPAGGKLAHPRPAWPAREWREPIAGHATA